ncbi:MAG TPA: hypothetical protein VG057_21635 [Solirubrobacteraceae bacterium]|jgi:hypothetical protein|nr:hypothetical protein [Solirubrobacteraceae bacterium]
MSTQTHQAGLLLLLDVVCAGVVLALITLVVLFLIVSVRVLVAVSVVVFGGSVIVVDCVLVIV